MTSDEWQQIKIADRLAADREFNADASIAKEFWATWGPGEGAAIDFDQTIPLSQEDDPPWTGDCPRPVIWE